MELLVRILNKALSFVAFLTAATLVVYMLVVIVTGTLDVANLMLGTVLLDPAERQSIFNGLNPEFLHNVAVLIVLMKAYRILIEYMRYHHIDIKYMVEIAIIACVLEILFNYKEYSENMLWIFLTLSVTFLALYTFKYDVLVRAIKDTQDKVCRPVRETDNISSEEVVEVKKKPVRRVRKVAKKTK